ncbi:MAG: GIY-YIG nuclease family protein [Flavobacteriaceae bacterium]|nr:GIY-YIG nuclease family protein [Flavobacteriaceae bacterium]
MSGFVYILTNKNHTVLYTGVTSVLMTRITEHKECKYPKSFNSKYNCDKLVYFEEFETIEEAIYREKQIKACSRKKKIQLILEFNPEWLDLYDRLSQ